MQPPDPQRYRPPSSPPPQPQYPPYQSPYPAQAPPPVMLYPPPRGLSQVAVAFWIMTTAAGVGCVIALIVAFSVQPSDLNAFACALGSVSDCNTWRVANAVHTLATITCIACALGAGGFGITALVLTLTRR